MPVFLQQINIKMTNVATELKQKYFLERKGERNAQQSVINISEIDERLLVNNFDFSFVEDNNFVSLQLL